MATHYFDRSLKDYLAVWLTAWLRLKETSEKTKAFLKAYHGDHSPPALADFDRVWEYFDKREADNEPVY